MSEHKIRSYLFYVIGEIVLVVIGILIALQINSWKEEKADAVKEQAYLSGFKSDLLANQQEISSNLYKADIILKRLDTILKINKGLYPNVSLDRFAENILFATAYNTYNSQEGSIDDIMGSGRLGIIKNDSIRQAISSWDNSLRTIREQEKIDYDSGTAYADLLKHDIAIYKILDEQMRLSTEEQLKLLDNDVFLNLVSERKYQKGFLIELYKKEANRLKQLETTVDLELKKFQ